MVPSRAGWREIYQFVIVRTVDDRWLGVVGIDLL